MSETTSPEQPDEEAQADLETPMEPAEEIEGDPFEKLDEEPLDKKEE
jgi:hypothetical protein